MPSQNRPFHVHFSTSAAAYVVISVVVLSWTGLFGRSMRTAPNRCRPGLIAMAARCCAPGQTYAEGHCVGTPHSCPAPYQKTHAGCLLPQARVLVPQGQVTLGPTDWDSAEFVGQRQLTVEAFYIDRAEVDQTRYRRCVEAGSCPAVPLHLEPGLPVTQVSARSAQAFCAHAGGRLPSQAEWIYAASGQEARRYPWGAHGLVCRRASFGLHDGPCAEHGVTPDLPASRPDGASPLGVFDLAGNVAEWALDEHEQPSVRGGSFRSKTPAALKSWSATASRVADDVGFRCAYDITQKQGPPTN
ncbi:MAG TPA: SUMF1/EgtB/PvdO family nonheme iron enzyme [Polyangiaceae bacterium]|nr:SUMF1/EgtB/PvdO family nonheme iron enzyme [Polyangiaceae bacterium]